MAAATRLCFCAHVGHPARMISSPSRCVPQAIENLFVSAAVPAGQVLFALLRGRVFACHGFAVGSFVSTRADREVVVVSDSAQMGSKS
jgi:hypothetical protein